MPLERMAVKRRWRPDPMSVSQPADFRLGGKTCIGQTIGRVSPYCYDAKAQQLVLVETPREADLLQAPFYYQSQHAFAQAVIVGEVEQDGQSLPPTILIYSTGRSGTTLLSKMLSRTPSCVSLSEPDVPTSLLTQGVAGQTAVDLLRASSQLYFRAHAGEQSTHLALKFRGMCVELAALYRQALPGAVELFLYRDAESYVASSMAAFSYFPSPLWGIRRMHAMVVTRPLLAYLLGREYPVICRYFPQAASYSPRELAQLGPVGLLTISWLSMMDRARLQAEIGAPLHALHYEQLKSRPEQALQRIFTLSALPRDDLPRALTALSEDSQRGSVVGRERRQRYELSASDKQTIREVLSRHPIIRHHDYELPHAIV